MRTRSSRSTSPLRELVRIPRRHRRRSTPTVGSEIRTVSTSAVTMAEDRPMCELLQAPIEGYGDAIVVPAIVADNFELKNWVTQSRNLKSILRF